VAHAFSGVTPSLEGAGIPLMGIGFDQSAESTPPKGSTMNARNALAANAALHCLTGCAIGEILGLLIGTAIGLSTGATIALAVGLAFLFGYALSTVPLVQAGLGFFAALSVVFAADTLSIAVMEIVDNTVMAIIPGAMDAGLVNPVFWLGMMIALSAAFIAAFPLNRYLIEKGKGHALTHRYHAGHDHDGHDHAGHERRDEQPQRPDDLAAVEHSSPEHSSHDGTAHNHHQHGHPGHQH
jgi:hypothetical protein